MSVRTACCLTILLFAAAPCVIGCNENHAPAATSGSSSGIGTSSETATGRGGDQSAVASAQQDETVAPDQKQVAKTNRDVAAESSKQPDKPSAASTATTAASRLPRGAAGGASDITFDTIKFQMEKTEPFRPQMLTPAIRALDGRRIRVRGYILPSFQQSGITQFVLVRDNMQCCFGPGAALFDCIVVEMAPGKSTEFKVQPVTVEGAFSLRDLLDPDGKHLAIYHLTGESVR